MKPFWLTAFPYFFWPCAACAVWLVYGMVAHGDFRFEADTIKLVGLLIASYLLKGQAERKHEAWKQGKQALRAFAEEEDRKLESR